RLERPASTPWRQGSAQWRRRSTGSFGDLSYCRCPLVLTTVPALEEAAMPRQRNVRSHVTPYPRAPPCETSRLANGPMSSRDRKIFARSTSTTIASSDREGSHEPAEP